MKIKDPQGYILLGLAIAAQLMLKGRADLVIRLASDPGLASRISLASLETMRITHGMSKSVLMGIVDSIIEVEGGETVGRN